MRTHRFDLVIVLSGVVLLCSVIPLRAQAAIVVTLAPSAGRLPGVYGVGQYVKISWDDPARVGTYRLLLRNGTTGSRTILASGITEQKHRWLIQDVDLCENDCVIEVVAGAAGQGVVAFGTSPPFGIKAYRLFPAPADSDQLGGRTPLILVHGIDGTQATWDAFIDTFFSDGTDNRIRRRYKPYVFVYESHLWAGHYSRNHPAPNHDPSVIDIAQALKSEFRRELASEGAPGFVLLAHSLGGLVARELLQNQSEKPGTLSQGIGLIHGKEPLGLITLATPHRGAVPYAFDLRIPSSRVVREMDPSLDAPRLLRWARLNCMVLGDCFREAYRVAYLSRTFLYSVGAPMGFVMLVVSEDSALLSGAVRSSGRERRFPTCDHSTIHDRVCGNVSPLGQIGVDLLSVFKDQPPQSPPPRDVRASQAVADSFQKVLGRAPTSRAGTGTATFAYVGNSGSISVIDTASNAVVATVPLGGDTQSAGVAVHPTGTRVYVIAYGLTGGLWVIDTATNTVAAHPAGFCVLSGVAVHPAGTRIYVATTSSACQPQNVAVIDGGTNAVLTRITTAYGANGVAINAAGTRLYVTSAVGGIVSVIDTVTNAVLAEIPSVRGASAVTVHPTGRRVYVTNMGYSTVSVIDTVTNAVVATVPVGSNPAGVAVNAAGTRVYVANLDNTVSIIDTASNIVVTTVPLGLGFGGAGIAVHPAGTLVYVTNSIQNSVSVIDTATNTVIKTVAVGGYPQAAGIGVVPR